MYFFQIHLFDYEKYIVLSYLKKNLIRFCVLYEKLGSAPEFTTAEKVKKVIEAKRLLRKKSFTINAVILRTFLPKKLLIIGQYSFVAVMGFFNFSVFFNSFLSL